jgi:hypothetical protein
MRNLMPAYEEADVRQHATFPTAANGWKEPILPDVQSQVPDLRNQLSLRLLNDFEKLISIG